MRIIFAAGGTGGHIAPALAVAEALKERCSALNLPLVLSFIGSGKEIEHRLISGKGYRLLTVPSSPFIGKGVGGVAKFIATVPRAVRVVREIFAAERPQVVVGFGGYPSFFPVLVAALCGVPRAIQEQNVKSGVANRALGLLANRVFAVPNSRGFILCSSKLFELPNPVRSEYYTVARWRPPTGGNPLQLLILGGSQGAVSLNSAVLECVSVFERFGVCVVHQAGKLDLERVRAGYAQSGSKLKNLEVVEFIDDLPASVARAHLVISRAGAMGVAEISAAGRPAIYVPLSIAGGHQQENVRQLVTAGAARILFHGPQLGQELAEVLAELLGDYSKLESMVASFPPGVTVRSAELMADEILALAGSR